MSRQPPDIHVPARIAVYLRTPGQLRRDVTWCGIRPEHGDQIEQAAAELLQCPARLADLGRCATELFGDAQWLADPWRDTPRDDTAGERFFLILPLLQHVQPAREAYAARGIPERILRDTLADFQIWIDTQIERTGRVEFREVGWLRESLRGRVFRLGRLQFQPVVPCTLPFTLLVNTRSGIYCLVAHGGRRITTSGIFADSEGAAEHPGIELAFTEHDGEIRTAHPVLLSGLIATAPAAFEPGAWQRVLAPGTPVTALHIPAGAPLDFDACRDAFRQAETFFPRYFGDHPRPRAATCTSWMFTSALGDILAPDANLVRFQRAFYRFPVPNATSAQAIERVFTFRGRVLNRTGLTSSLQRRLFDWMQTGDIPLNAGGLFPAPLSNWGTLFPPR